MRINETLVKTEEVAIWTKEELQKQNAKLMIIDESLNRVESLSVRLGQMSKRLRKSIQADKLHCFLSLCICLNLILLIVLLFTTIGDDEWEDYQEYFWEQCMQEGAPMCDPRRFD